MSDLPPPPGGDWAAQTADTIERLVGQIRSRTTRPAVTAARGLVYGLLAAILGIAAVVLLIAALVRILAVLLPEVWMAYLLLGVVFTVVGAVLMLKRHAPPEVS
jgi:uncharacterized protein YacL